MWDLNFLQILLQLFTNVELFSTHIFFAYYKSCSIPSRKV